MIGDLILTRSAPVACIAPCILWRRSQPERSAVGVGAGSGVEVGVAVCPDEDDGMTIAMLRLQRQDATLSFTPKSYAPATLTCGLLGEHLHNRHSARLSRLLSRCGGRAASTGHTPHALDVSQLLLQDPVSLLRRASVAIGTSQDDGGRPKPDQSVA